MEEICSSETFFNHIKNLLFHGLNIHLRWSLLRPPLDVITLLAVQVVVWFDRDLGPLCLEVVSQREDGLNGLAFVFRLPVPAVVIEDEEVIIGVIGIQVEVFIAVIYSGEWKESERDIFQYL